MSFESSTKNPTRKNWGDDDDDDDDAWETVQAVKKVSKQQQHPEAEVYITCDACGDACYNLHLNELKYTEMRPLCDVCVVDHAVKTVGLKEKETVKEYFPAKCDSCNRRTKDLMLVKVQTGETDSVFKIRCETCLFKMQPKTVKPVDTKPKKSTSRPKNNAFSFLGEEDC